ncbi:MAG TPA: archaeosine tRNA-ribosyltransferase [Methanothermobacter sp.]|nr:archaeosine tRNA-ribosyltransferase [Methanothermobacter sp.]
MKKFEIKLHDGPARLGMIDGMETPAIIDYKTIEFAQDQPTPYNVPIEIARWSVKETIKNAKSSKREYAVIHGAKYLDLRVKCAMELESLGFKKLIIANGDELLTKPADLIRLTVKIRENIKPDTLLCFPYSEASFIPILVYMGVDLFTDAICKFYSYLNILMTPNHSYKIDKYKIYKLNESELSNYNKGTLDFVIREVKEHIKMGTLRNLVEEKAATSPANMTALRILDDEFQEYLQRYTRLY